MRRLALIATLTGLFLLGTYSAGATSPRQDSQQQSNTDKAKQDAKNVGHDTKDAAKNAGGAAKNGGKKGVHEGAKGVSKGAQKTQQGADKLKDKTGDNSDK